MPATLCSGVPLGPPAAVSVTVANADSLTLVDAVAVAVAVGRVVGRAVGVGVAIGFAVGLGVAVGVCVGEGVGVGNADLRIVLVTL